MRRLSLAAIAALMTLALTASGTFAAGTRHRLHYEGTGTHAWTMGNDSPTEADSRFLRIVLDPGEYVAAFSNRSLNLNKPAGLVKNLSFNYRATNPDLIGQRISVIFVNGDIGYLDSHYCHRDIAVSGGAWQRSDFTGWRSADCSFYVTGTTGGQYFGTASSSAWAAYVAANPGQQVAYTFFIEENAGASTGTFDVDDITIGSGKLYTRRNLPSKSCDTEASC
ncbi:MAG TPA: hypothetical protein VFH98_01185 [Candidatus Limnocylindria bacterium]|jgi:hypothetical protein|nr:hypothetical protein [Candidatus Limnocylindria bacterium]